MISDDRYFLNTKGIRIYNNRNEKDKDYVNENFYEGM